MACLLLALRPGKLGHADAPQGSDLCLPQLLLVHRCFQNEMYLSRVPLLMQTERDVKSHDANVVSIAFSIETVVAVCLHLHPQQLLTGGCG